jgi:hypothetical protein
MPSIAFQEIINRPKNACCDHTGWLSELLIGKQLIDVSLLALKTILK